MIHSVGHINYQIEVADVTFDVQNCHTNTSSDRNLEISSDNIKSLALIAYYFQNYKSVTFCVIGESAKPNNYDYTLNISGNNLTDIIKKILPEQLR